MLAGGAEDSPIWSNLLYSRVVRRNRHRTAQNVGFVRAVKALQPRNAGEAGVGVLDHRGTAGHQPMSFAPLSPRWIGLDVRSLALFRVAVSNALFWDQLNSFFDTPVCLPVRQRLPQKTSISRSGVLPSPT